MPKLRSLFKNLSVKGHRLGLRAGLFIVPVSYYASLSNILELKRTKADWARKSKLDGLDIDLQGQALKILQICKPFQSEFTGNAAYRKAITRKAGPGFGYIEAQALHGAIRFYKPKQIIEVGSGVSTFCMLEALKKNEQETGVSSNLTCIEPYPSKALLSLLEVHLIQKKVQRVPASVFGELNAGDLLFIDSSHTVRPDSDVVYLILEVLPRLKKGVIVHFHDIYFPYGYQRDILNTYFQWMETSLLQAFLAFNSKFKTVFCMSQLHYEFPEVLREVFREYKAAPDVDGLASRNSSSAASHFPASIYIEAQQ